MAAYDKDWTFEEMNGYLKKPQSYIKGTKMAFAGLRKEKTEHLLFCILTKIQIIHYLYLNFPKQYNRILFEHELCSMPVAKHEKLGLKKLHRQLRRLLVNNVKKYNFFCITN